MAVFQLCSFRLDFKGHAVPIMEFPDRAKINRRDFSSNKNSPTKLAQSWQCVPKQPFSKKFMEGKLRFHARYQKCSLLSIEGLEVMTVNIEEGKHGGGEKMSVETQSALA